MKFACPHCAQRIEAENSWAGKQINCPTCQHSFFVPQPRIVVPTSPKPPPIIPETQPVPPTLRPPPGSVSSCCTLEGATLKLRIDASEIIQELQSVLNKKLGKNGMTLWWTEESCSPQLFVRVVAMDQGNQFMRWLLPFVAPAVLEVEGQVAVNGLPPQAFHYVQRTHFGVFGGTARYMLKVCAQRAAAKIAADVKRALAA
jgi:hypothetical protein